MIRLPKPKRPPAAAIRALLASLLAACLAGHLLGGCYDDGGTTSEGGNPSLVVGFRKDGKEVDFQGFIQIYADEENPGFYTPAPEDGSKKTSDDPPRITTDGEANLFYPLSRVKTFSIYGREVAFASGFRVLLPRLPATDESEHFELGAAKGPGDGKSVRPFNVYVDGLDSTLGYARGLSYDSAAKTYRDADGVAFDVLWVDLTPSSVFSGTVDTAGFAGKPMAVFSPGSPIAAPVHGGRFLLGGLPKLKLPMRLVTEDGVVHAFTDLLDATQGDPNSYNSLPPLVPAEALDTLVVPPAVRVLETPAASPAGPLNFTDSLVVTLTAQEGTTIFYTQGATDPSTLSTEYTGPIVLRSHALIRAVAYRKGFNHSAISTNSYVLVPPAPKANPTSQAFRDSLVVSLSTTAKNGLILYTLDGSAPHAGSRAYSAPLVLKATTVLKAATSAPGLSLSDVTEEHYILVPDTLGQP